MNTKLTEQKALDLLEDNLKKYSELTLKEANTKDLYKALAQISHDILFEKREKFHSKVAKSQAKRVHYLCMEFLLGRNLKSTLFNLGIDKVYAKILKNLNIDIEDVYEEENDAGLGNGGLGRLAACFMDSLATLEYPSMGHSILYEYGLFKQKIVDGEQIELTDSWRSTGDFWLQKRQEKSVIVKFGGNVVENYIDGKIVPTYQNYTEVQAIPYDMVLSGYDTDGVAVLRLWEAKSINKFDLNSFSQGAYVKAVAEASEIEMISKVLYPADDHYEGKTLRLKQQYFLVSSALQNIISTHIKRCKNLKSLADMVVIHINDTHPALCIPELMRILMDEYGWEWDKAWEMVTKTINYTNHTVLMEALEKWDENLFRTTLPRIYQIVKEINRRFTKDLLDNHMDSFDLGTIDKMSIVSTGQVRMANLSVIASNHVNGVSKLHSDIIRTDLFGDFNKLYPKKFTNVTNGIAHRRWLCQSNPNLTKLIDSSIGTNYYYNAQDLRKLKNFVEDKSFLNKLNNIKQKNKHEFAEYLKKSRGILVDPNMRFDVHVKRIHEYKRQLLNVLKIIYLYSELLENPDKDVTPQVFFFGGKSASKYYMAKRIIKLICKLSQEIDKNPVISAKLKVVFLENYNVSLAEKIIPATEVSEQISLAGKEASGTGNMKFMINGALTLGTYDGANVEMCDCVGRDNIFIFGLSSEKVDNEWKVGYNPREIYENNPRVHKVVDMLKVGFDGESFDDIAKYLIDGNRPDPYMCLIDFDSYLEAYYKMDETYKDFGRWAKMSLCNIAGSGFFAADRSIVDYAKNIWNLKPIKYVRGMYMENFIFNPINNKTPSGACAKGTSVKYTLKVSKFAGLERAYFVMHKDGEDSNLFEMTKKYADERYYYMEFTYTYENEGFYWYHFEVKTKDNYLKLIRADNLDIMESHADSDYLQLVITKESNVDKAFKKGIIYHIFVDRFNKVGEVKARSGLKLISDWSKELEVEYNEKGERVNKNCYGGNFAGIIEKLPYLKSLNVGTIYLSPIMEANSNHKYDVADYSKVDSMFGSQEDFESLIKEAKKLGMSVIIDGVFNHTGSDSVYFNKDGRYRTVGAYQSQNSKYYSWYSFKKYPDDYSCWWGIKTLPQTEENSGFFDYIAGRGGIIEKYMSMGIGGFRLDVVDELTNNFLHEICNASRRVNPKAFMIGEVWEDASSKISYDERKEYFLGGNLDSVTNYPMKNAILEFVKYGKVENFVNVVNLIKDQYPKSIQNNLMNIIDTHDTIRALSYLGANLENVSQYENYKLTPAERFEGLKLLKLATILQYTIMGLPTVFYGDEAGIEGMKDPYCRATYPWGNEDLDLIEWYKKLGALRNNKVFESGDMNIKYAQDGVLIFERVSEDKKVIVAVNRSNDDFEFTLAKSMCNFFTGDYVSGKIQLQKDDAIVLI